MFCSDDPLEIGDSVMPKTVYRIDIWEGKGVGVLVDELFSHRSIHRYGLSTIKRTHPNMMALFSTTGIIVKACGLYFGDHLKDAQ